MRLLLVQLWCSVALARLPMLPDAMTRLTRCTAQLLLPDLVIGKWDLGALWDTDIGYLLASKDPLVYQDGLRTCQAAAALEGIRLVIGGAAELDLPVLMLHGDRDRACGLSGSHLLHWKLQRSSEPMHVRRAMGRGWESARSAGPCAGRVMWPASTRPSLPLEARSVWSDHGARRCSCCLASDTTSGMRLC